MTVVLQNSLCSRVFGWFSRAPLSVFFKTGAFALRVFLSVGLALLVAFTVQLDSPMSTVTTVIIVAHPAVGALISKSVWRVLGTVFGAGLSVAIMGCFVQSAWLYFIALAFFVGLACMTASLLRLYRAYAAVLAGYTIIIVAFAAFSHPETVFMSAMMRLSDVVVGVVSTAIIFMATSPRRNAPVYLALNDAFLAVLQHAKSFHGTQTSERLYDGLDFRMLPADLYDSRQTVLKKLTALAPSLEYAASDNPDIKDHLSSFKMAVNQMSGIVATYHPHWKNLHQPHPEFQKFHTYAVDVLNALLSAAQSPAWMQSPEKVLDILHSGIQSLTDLENNPGLTSGSLASVQNIKRLFLSLRQIVLDITGKKTRRSARTPSYFEWPEALRNGARGALITLLACFVWYVTAWPTGPMMMLYVIAVSSLLSTVPSASRASVTMAIGTILSIPATLLYHVYILPQIDGYGFLWFSLCIFLLPGIWLQFHPRYSIGAFGYAVFFAIQSLVTNEMVYDDIALTNTWMAIICGAALLVLVFRVLLPPNHTSDAMRIMKALRDSVNTLATLPGRHLPTPEEWQGAQIQKLSRLALKLSFLDQKETARSLLDQGFSLVSLGKLILELRVETKNTFEERAVQMFLRETVLRSKSLSYETKDNAALSRIGQILFILEHQHESY